MQRSLSRKFTFYTFICIALLLFVHGYNLQVAYLTPFSLVNEKLTFTTFIEYFLANGLLRFRIPILFAISGYFFSTQDGKPYGERIKKRFFTLIIPYFIWGAVGLAITYLLQQFPLTAQAVQKATIDQLGDNRPYNDIGWSGILFRWVVAPPSYQLWFIRSLFVYNLLYPVFRRAVRKYPVALFTVLFLVWITMLQLPLVEGQGMFFFALGIWLQKRSYPIDRKPDWFSYYLSWLVFAGVCVIKTFMAFEFEERTPLLYWVLTILHIVAIIAGVIAVWFSFDPVVDWFMERKWFVWASAFSFFIYGLHIPILAYVTALFFQYKNSFPGYRLFTYLSATSIVLLFCIITGALLRKLLPKVYNVMTGGRGF